MKFKAIRIFDNEYTFGDLLLLLLVVIFIVVFKHILFFSIKTNKIEKIE
jgi:hypothetical protein